MPTLVIESRCAVCDHWPDEHIPMDEDGGCAGCDAARQPLEVLEHDYVRSPLFDDTVPGW